MDRPSSFFFFNFKNDHITFTKPNTKVIKIHFFLSLLVDIDCWPFLPQLSSFSFGGDMAVECEKFS